MVLSLLLMRNHACHSILGYHREFYNYRLFVAFVYDCVYSLNGCVTLLRVSMMMDS